MNCPRPATTIHGSAARRGVDAPRPGRTGQHLGDRARRATTTPSNGAATSPDRHRVSDGLGREPAGLACHARAVAAGSPGNRRGEREHDEHAVRRENPSVSAVRPSLRAMTTPTTAARPSAPRARTPSRRPSRATRVRPGLYASARKRSLRLRGSRPNERRHPDGRCLPVTASAAIVLEPPGVRFLPAIRIWQAVHAVACVIGLALPVVAQPRMKPRPP